MRKGKISSLVFVVFIVVFLTSTSPHVPSYGGKIWFINNSSYNLLLEFLGGYSGYRYSSYNVESKIFIEKQERLPINHVFLDREPANPNDYFKQLKIYDTDTGNPLKEIQITDILFTLDSGSTDSCNAEFSFLITNSLF
jgi:hypothetical protein